MQLISLATILSEKLDSVYAPFLLKIDIEGGEQTLFAGDTTAFNRFPMIAIELHDWMLTGQRSSHSFLAFHTASGRELAVLHENVVSLAFELA